MDPSNKSNPLLIRNQNNFVHVVSFVFGSSADRSHKIARSCFCNVGQYASLQNLLMMQHFIIIPALMAKCWQLRVLNWSHVITSFRKARNLMQVVLDAIKCRMLWCVHLAATLLDTHLVATACKSAIWGFGYAFFWYRTICVMNGYGSWTIHD